MNIGDRVKHKINGFQGVITGKTEYANGCRQYLVIPELLDKDGKIQDGTWIDEQYWILVKEHILPNPFATPGPATAGGPDRKERSVR